MSTEIRSRRSALRWVLRFVLLYALFLVLFVLGSAPLARVIPADTVSEPGLMAPGECR